MKKTKIFIVGSALVCVFSISFIYCQSKVGDGSQMEKKSNLALVSDTISEISGQTQGDDESEYDWEASGQATVNTAISKTGRPPILSYSNIAIFKFSCNSAPCTFKCQLDSAGWENCKSPETYLLDDGLHTFFVKAFSSAGTDRTPAKYSWTINGAQTAEGYELAETVNLLETKGYTDLLKSTYHKVKDSNLKIYSRLYSNKTRDKAAILEYVVDNTGQVYRCLVTEILPTGEALVYDFLETNKFEISSDGTITPLSENPAKIVNKMSPLISSSSNPCDYFNKDLSGCIKGALLSNAIGAGACIMGGPLGLVLAKVSQGVGVVQALMKRDVIGFLSGFLPCGSGVGFEVSKCLLEGMNPSSSCSDGDACNGIEYCSWPDNTCHNSSVTEPDGTDCPYFCIQTMSGQCKDSHCTSVGCQPDGFWNYTCTVTAQNGTCENEQITFSCGNGTGCLYASKEYSNEFPIWSFNNKTCTGSGQDAGDLMLYGKFTSAGTCSFEGDAMIYEYIINYLDLDCSCTYSCEGVKWCGQGPLCQ